MVTVVVNEIEVSLVDNSGVVIVDGTDIPVVDIVELVIVRTDIVLVANVEFGEVGVQEGPHAQAEK